MKKLLSITLILATLILVSACGDDIPDNLPENKIASAEKTASMSVAANSSASTEITFTNRDFTGIQEFLNYIKDANVQTSSHISIQGITNQDVNLTNVKLTLKRDSKVTLSLPTITANDRFDELNHLNFLQAVLDEIVRRGSSTVVLDYKSSNDMQSPVTMKIRIDSRFHF